MLEKSGRGRPFAKALALLGAGVLASSLVACGSSEDEDSSGPENKIELQNTTDPATGTLDVLNWGVPFGEPPTIDPAKGADNSVYFVTSNLCDGLLTLNPDYSVGPNLAESWEYGADNLTLAFKIRQGVQFTDGAPLTAEDVAFSLGRHIDPVVASIYAGSVYSNVAAVDVTAPDEVTVTFKAPDSLFLKAMAVTPGLILEQKYVEEQGAAFGSPSAGVVCTGAYKLDEWSPGSGMTLSANPDYWNEEVTPHAQEVDLKFISDASALTQALQSGALDGSYEVPPSAIEPLEKTDGEIYYGPSPAMLQIYTVAPGAMEDVKLRQAFSKLVDRDAIAEQVYAGAASPNQVLVPNILWDAESEDTFQAGYDALPKDTEPDLEAAKKLIGEMDSPPESLTMVVIAGNEPMRLTSTLLQQQAKEVGIDLEIKQIQPAENASYFVDPTAREGVDLIMNTGWSAVPDALFYPRRVVLPTGLFNLVKFDDSTVESKLTEAIQSFDVAERTELFTEAQEIYEPAKVVVPLVNTREILYMRKGLTGAITSFAYVYSPSLAHIGPTGS